MIIWDIGIDIYTLLHMKHVVNKDLLYSTGNASQHSVMTYMGIESKQEWIHAQAWLSHVSIQQKLTQHCKSTKVQSKLIFKKFEKSTFRKEKNSYTFKKSKTQTLCQLQNKHKALSNVLSGFLNGLLACLSAMILHLCVSSGVQLSRSVVSDSLRPGLPIHH